MAFPATSYNFAAVALPFDSRGRALSSLSLIFQPSVMLCMKTAIYQQLELCNAAFFPQVLVAIIDRYVARLELEAFNLLNLRSD